MPDIQESEVFEVLSMFVKENAPAIAADEGKVYELVGATPEETKDTTAVASVASQSPSDSAETERLSTLQKIAKMKVGERVKLAMTGSKEDRYILVRDGSKVVSSAVLASPKISEQEIETIASMKNVQESVLRDLARNRKFMKSYSVVKNLVNNPRCPLDISLALMKNLLVPDLKGLSLNKNVPETLKKLALKNFQEKTAGKRA